MNEEIKIPRKLFVDLINYFYPDDESVPQGVLADEIRHQIEDKIQKITNREYFLQNIRLLQALLNVNVFAVSILLSVVSVKLS